MHRVYSSAAFITCQRIWCVRMCWGAGGTCLSLLCVMTGWSCSLSPNLNSAYSAVHASCRTEPQQDLDLLQCAIFSFLHPPNLPHIFFSLSLCLFSFICGRFWCYIASKVLVFSLSSSCLKSQGLLWLSALIFITFTLSFSFCLLWSGLFSHVRHRDETELQNFCKTGVIQNLLHHG